MSRPKKIKHNGKVNFILKKFGKEIANFPEEFGESKIRDIIAFILECNRQYEDKGK